MKLNMLKHQNQQREAPKQSKLAPPPRGEVRIETQVGITQDNRVTVQFNKPVRNWLLTPESALTHAKAMLQGVKMVAPALLKDFEL